MQIRTALIALLVATPAFAQAPAPAAYQAPDYRNPASWLCRPGAKDVCSGDIDTTVITADGTITLDAVPAAKKPAIDCFYVYPTVSTDPTDNSDMVADPAETNVARTQLAAFRQVCRTYAPLYRQVTLKALRARMLGMPANADRAMAYNDVAAAFADYLKHDNKGRSFILLGHSQGSGLIKQLIQQEIEGKPVAKRMISAMIPGNNVLVPQGADVGGDFKSTPLCRAAGQTGCVLAWVSWRAESPVPPMTLFGRTTQPGMVVACTNPAALAGGKVDLNSILPNSAAIVDNGPPLPKWAKGRNIYTPFVGLPALT
ncbi:MAG: DUF3089 domain-containing protein, partial [Sphingomonadales bacterium]